MIEYYRFTEKELKTLLKSMVILIDTRENVNEHISRWLDKKKIPYKVQKLNVADYSFMLPSNPELGIVRDLYFTDKIAIERKNSLEELSGCFTNTRTAFENEFIRSQGKVYLLIENACYEDIITHKYKTDYNPNSFLASLHSFADRYNISVNFIKDNRYSGQFIYYTFYYWLRNYLLNR